MGSNNDIHCKLCGQANWLPNVAGKQQEYITRLEAAVLTTSKELEFYDVYKNPQGLEVVEAWDCDGERFYGEVYQDDFCIKQVGSDSCGYFAGKNARKGINKIKDLVTEIQTREALKEAKNGNTKQSFI